MPNDDGDKRVLNYCEEVLLFERDVRLLDDRNWLNDQIISFALEYIYQEILPSAKQAKACIVSSNVCELFKFGDTDLIKQVCSDLGFAKKELLLLPVNDNDKPSQTGGSHWSLLAFHRKANRFEYFDSLSYSNLDTAKSIASACESLLETAKKPKFNLTPVPLQQNGSDCGVYLIEFAKVIVQAFAEGVLFLDFSHITPSFIKDQRKKAIMLTPVFEVSQDDQFLLITVRAPFAKITDTEIEYHGNEFLFVSKPYFLRLYLPKEVVDNDTGTAEYDSDKGYFNIKVPKLVPGEVFTGLDMITELLRPKGAQSAKPLIEECNDDEDEQILLAQSVPNEDGPVPEDTCSKFGYGFAWRRFGVFRKLQEEISQLIDLADPDDRAIDQRLQLCRDMNQQLFNEDHYLADLYSPDDGLTAALKLELPSDEKLSTLSFEDRDRMKDLPKKRWELSTAQHTTVALSLADLLFAYLYDYRTTECENTVESSWTIVKLSPTLSFLVKYADVKEAIVGTFERSLVFPLYRNWELSVKVLEDVRRILRLGRIAILKCLLVIHRLLASHGEYRYILNDLYVTDYCVWIQTVPDAVLDQLATEISAFAIAKDMLCLDLEEVELAGRLATLNCSENGPESNAVVSDQQCLRSVAVSCGLIDSDDEQ
uniref:Protein SHQ1 homolog n=1 Tax=Plectus sambesii TaxID=2011161 RepID=A0A914XDS5_9BILA